MPGAVVGFPPVSFFFRSFLAFPCPTSNDLRPCSIVILWVGRAQLIGELCPLPIMWHLLGQSPKPTPHHQQSTTAVLAVVPSAVLTVMGGSASAVLTVVSEILRRFRRLAASCFSEFDGCQCLQLSYASAALAVTELPPNCGTDSSPSIFGGFGGFDGWQCFQPSNASLRSAVSTFFGGL